MMNGAEELLLLVQVEWTRKAASLGGAKRSLPGTPGWYNEDSGRLVPSENVKRISTIVILPKLYFRVQIREVGLAQTFHALL